MDVFLLRHGQSEYNIGLSTHLDSPLTTLGQAQAARAAERLSGEDIKAVFASPLRRTLQTAAPFCQLAELQADVVADACEYFASSEYADFPGMSVDAIQRAFPFARVGEMFACDPARWWPQNVETDAHIYARAERVRDALLARYAATETHILIISHADTVGRLTEAFLRVPPRPDNPPWSDNCGVSRLSCSAQLSLPAKLIYQNDSAYLGELRS